MRNLDFNNERRFVHNKFYWNSRLSGHKQHLLLANKKHFKSYLKNGSGLQYTTVYYHRLRNINPNKSYRGTENNYWVYGIVLKTPNLRDKLIENLYNNK